MQQKGKKNIIWYSKYKVHSWNRMEHDIIHQRQTAKMFCSLNMMELDKVEAAKTKADITYRTI